jgi:hypothetical protein
MQVLPRHRKINPVRENFFFFLSAARAEAASRPKIESAPGKSLKITKMLRLLPVLQTP